METEGEVTGGVSESVLVSDEWDVRVAIPQEHL